MHSQVYSQQNVCTWASRYIYQKCAWLVMVHIETAPCLLVAKWINKLCYSHKSEQYTGMKPQPHTTAQMNFTNKIWAKIVKHKSMHIVWFHLHKVKTWAKWSMVLSQVRGYLWGESGRQGLGGGVREASWGALNVLLSASVIVTHMYLW